jgi:outer membrane protein OmpA-like peptidoglycan-associated protein
MPIAWLPVHLPGKLAMKFTMSATISICAGFLVGCAASIPSPELIDARQAYAHASAKLSAHQTSVELTVAREALVIAERSFRENPQSFRARDLAYIANRRAKLAEAVAGSASSLANTTQANKDYHTTQSESETNSQEYQAAAERGTAINAVQFAGELRAGSDAKKRALGAQAALVKVAAVREEPRGLVITLSSSALFASNTSALSPAAQHQLNRVAEALLVTKERKLIVEGHTDSRGPSSRNRELSLRRADAVRAYFIARGYPADRIQAQGIGNERPMSDYSSAQGRENNGRVEIIMDPHARE